jgi:DNA-binding transcriptional LysR family regulator
VQQLVDEGDLDAGFGYLFTQTAGVHKQPLFSDPLTLIVPRDGYLQCRSMQTAKEWACLGDATLIVLNKNNPVMPVINDFLANGRAPAMRRMEVRHLATVLSMVGAGLGVAVVPGSALIGEQSRRVRPVPLGEDPPEVEHCCLTKAGAEKVAGLDDYVRLFVAICQGSIARARQTLSAE